MKQHNYVPWIALGLFLSSLASVLKFKDHAPLWRFQFSLVAAILFFILFAFSIYGAVKERKDKR